MDNKQTLIINLIGGPCSGKSTTAAELFARLKKMGIKTELVPEWIKEKIYEENNTITQIAVFGMEHYTISNKINKVDVIVHDGSFINNIIYKQEYNKYFDDLIINEYKKFCLLNEEISNSKIMEEFIIMNNLKN